MPSTWIHGFSLRFLLLLQNSTLTIEEFHSKLQEATNFPLRPFVVPFLKVNAPQKFFFFRLQSGKHLAGSNPDVSAYVHGIAHHVSSSRSFISILQQ